jgi:hypothetical protein
LDNVLGLEILGLFDNHAELLLHKVPALSNETASVSVSESLHRLAIQLGERLSN